MSDSKAESRQVKTSEPRGAVPAAADYFLAGAGLPTRSERHRLRLAAGAITLALATVVATLRFHRLSELPPGLYPDEALDGALALSVLQGEHAVFFPVDNGREASAIYALAFTTAIFGRTLLAMHLPTALGSAALVFAVFWLGQLLFGRTESGRASPWQGLLIGGVSAGLLAVSLGQTVIGRTAYSKVTHMTLLLCLCFAFLWQGWSKPASTAHPDRERESRTAAEQRGWWWFLLAGVCAGLLPYTYIPARFTPFLFLAYGLTFLAPLHASNRYRARAELPWAAVFAGVTGLVAAPILVYFVLHPDHFFLRSSEVSLVTAGGGPLAVLGALLVNLWDHLLAFGVRGDPNWRHNYPTQPMLPIWAAPFFWLGVGIAIRRWRRPAYRLLLLWILVLLLPAVLSRDDTVPHFLRLNGAVPAVYLLVGVGMWEAFRFLQDRFRWSGQPVPALAMGAAVTVSILFQGVFTYDTYFRLWASEPEMHKSYRPIWTSLINTLNEQPPNPSVLYLVPSLRGPFDLRYLYHGAAPTRVVDAASPDLAKEVESAYADAGIVSTVRVVEWNAYNREIEDDVDSILYLLNKYGSYLKSEDFAEFQLHSFTDISSAAPWTFYDYLEPLAVEYDGGIALQGLALGQGTAQQSTQFPLETDRDQPLWVALQWGTAPGLKIDYAISLRLYDEVGERHFQKDLVLRDFSFAPTSRWPGQHAVDTMIQLQMPAGLPAGEYLLKVIVYDTETLVPTVVVGVWEPEVTLASLLLTEAH